MPAGRTALFGLWAALACAGFMAHAARGWRDAGISLLAVLGGMPPLDAAGAARALAGHLLGLWQPLVLLAALWTAGRPLARWLGPRPDGGSGGRLVLGFGVVGLVVLGAGLAGLLARPLVVAPAAALAAAGVWCALRRRAWRAVWPADAASLLPACLCAAAVGAAWILARLPDFYEDAATYHFAAPEQFLALHRIHAEPAHLPWHFSLGGEMVVLPLWALGGILAAKLVSVAAAAAVVLVTRDLGDALGGRAAGVGWWAAAAAASAACVPLGGWAGKNDVLAAACFAAACRGLVAGPRGLAFSAWCLGQAIGVKYTTAYFVPGLGLAAWWAGSLRLRARPLLGIVVLAALPAAGWMIRNWLCLGNPFHPVFSGIFPELAWSPFYERALRSSVVSFSPAEAGSPADWLGAPWRALADPQLGSPLLLALLPVALAGSSGPATAARSLSALRIVLVGAYLAWVPSVRVVRFLVPLFPPLAAAGTAAAAPVARPWLKGAAAAAALWVMAGAMIPATVPSGWLYLLGQVSRDRFLAERYTTWDRMRRWVNARVPPDRSVLFTGEERRLWFVPRVVSSTASSELAFWRLTAEAHSAREMRKRLRQRGIAFLVHNFVTAGFRYLNWYAVPDWTDRQLAVYRDFVRAYCRPVASPPLVDYVNGGFWVFEFDRCPSSRPYPLYFLPQTEGRFRKAVRAAGEGHVSLAVAEAEGALQPVRGVRQAEELMAGLLRSAGLPGTALELLEDGLRDGYVGEGNAENAAVCAAKQGRMEDAVRWTCRGWLVRPDPGTIHDLGVLLFTRAGNTRDEIGGVRAVRDLDTATRLLAGDPRPPAAAALVLQTLGRNREAAEFASRALARDPASPELRELAARLTAAVVRIQ